MSSINAGSAGSAAKARADETETAAARAVAKNPRRPIFGMQPHGQNGMIAVFLPLYPAHLVGTSCQDATPRDHAAPRTRSAVESGKAKEPDNGRARPSFDAGIG